MYTSEIIPYLNKKVAIVCYKFGIPMNYTGVLTMSDDSYGYCHIDKSPHCIKYITQIKLKSSIKVEILDVD
jgi:hypothetical protein